jgi:hypothetical protein
MSIDIGLRGIYMLMFQGYRLKVYGGYLCWYAPGPDRCYMARTCYGYQIVDKYNTLGVCNE